MRILPSQSTVIKRNIRSTVFVHYLQVQTMSISDSHPVVDTGPAQRINTETGALLIRSSMSITCRDRYIGRK